MQSFTPEYKAWFHALKAKVRSVQSRTSVNAVLVELYWDIGKMISGKQTEWGPHFLEQVSCDLKAAFPQLKGFSVTNLKYCRLLYSYCCMRRHPGEHTSEKPAFI